MLNLSWRQSSSLWRRQNSWWKSMTMGSAISKIASCGKLHGKSRTISCLGLCQYGGTKPFLNVVFQDRPCCLPAKDTGFDKSGLDMRFTTKCFEIQILSLLVFSLKISMTVFFAHQWVCLLIFPFNMAKVLLPRALSQMLITILIPIFLFAQSVSGSSQWAGDDFAQAWELSDRSGTLWINFMMNTWVFISNQKFIDSLGDWAVFYKTNMRKNSMKIAIDAMGGNNAHRLWSRRCNQALRNFSDYWACSLWGWSQD